MTPSLSGRLFLALSLQDSTRDALRNHLESRLGAKSIPGRQVPPENWHFTLRFLGQVEEESAATICHLLREANLGGAFEIQIGGAGAFPSLHRAKALWLGVHEGREQMVALATAVDETLAQAGMNRDEHPFRPHLTISRFKYSEDVRLIAQSIEDFTLSGTVEDVSLYRSHLGHGPPRYEVVQRFPLGK